MRFDVAMENVGNARRFVQSSVAGAVPTRVAADLVLATSELVTNAFEHAAAPVVVIVRAGAGAASVTVRSGGVPDRIDDVDGWRTAPPDSVSGRGLGIVSHIADHVEFARVGDEVEITIRRRW
jgi:anti-sigma regulatory factor (Ser/Thr protein kinase)